MREWNDGYPRNLILFRFVSLSQSIMTKKRPHQGVFVFYKLGQFYLSDEAFSEDDFSDEALSLLLFPLSFSAGFDSFSPDLALPGARPAPEGERWSVA